MGKFWKRDRMTILFILIFFTCIKVQAQNIAGDWEGKLNVGIDLKLVFHFTKNNQGTLSGTMDSPDQNVKGILLSSVLETKDSVFLKSETILAEFKGAVFNDSTIKGVWIQGPGSFPLILSRQKTEIANPDSRPQTPMPPFSYNSDSVTYFNADNTIQYGATITYPKTGGPFPVAILITGSGQQDRDETIFHHKPFAVIADFLTKNGIAVLRIDDRGKGLTTGKFAGSTSADFANDVLAAIQYVSRRKDIDKNNIGLIGHSEGGMIAPMVYTKWPHLAFIVSLAGTGISGADILLRQQTAPIKTMGLDSAYQSYYTLTKFTLETIKNNSNSPDSIILQKIKTYYSEWKSKTSLSIQEMLHANEASPEDYATQVSDELKPWMKFFISTDPAIYWSKVKCPVLALNGEKDIQVYPEQNIPAIQLALEKAGNKKVTVKIFPGLNHLFQHCTACTVKEYGELTETFSPEVLETISNWIKQTIQ